MKKKFLVIHNPASGRSRHPLLAKVVQGLEALGHQLELYDTQAPGDATRYLKEYQGDADVVLACGGDGTVNEVVNGLVGKHYPIGLVPLGTTNLLAKELGIKKDPRQIIRLLTANSQLGVYPSTLNGRCFVMMAGAGYDAQVVNKVSLPLKKKIGQGAYIWVMLKQVLDYGKSSYKVLVDGQPHECSSLIVTNGRYYGGNFILSQHASVADPQMQVLLFKTKTKKGLLLCLCALGLGAMEKLASVESIAAKKVEILGESGELMQADGDPMGKLPATIEVVETPVYFLIPVS